MTVHGHGTPEINAAITAQLDRLDHSTFLGLTHEPGIRVAEELLRIAPAGLAKVFFAGDGSSAAEAAIKMAYQAATQRGEDRPLYVHCAEGYHGDTLGAVSLGGVELFHATYRPLLIETRMVSSPGVLAPGQTRADAGGRGAGRDARRCWTARATGCAPSSSSRSCRRPAACSPTTRRSCAGSASCATRPAPRMLVDEVATGIGATGRWFAVEHAGVTPDLMVVGKRVTGGVLPLSAVLVRDSVYEPFLGDAASGRTFFHGHTYTANPLCCAAALANLALMHERGTVAAGGRGGGAAGQRVGGAGDLRRRGRDPPGRHDDRHRGARRSVSVPASRYAAPRGGVGCIIRPLGDVVVLMPPLGITDDELAELLGVVDESVREVVQ